MKRAVLALDPWAPPLVLMAAIWFFSGQSSLDSGLGLADLIGRKLVHAGEYGLLCLLWWRVLRRSALPPAAAIALGWAIAVGYGALDEYWQTFTPGRVGSAVDVAIDAAGATVAALLLRRHEARATETDPTPPRSPRASRAR